MLRPYTKGCLLGLIPAIPLSFYGLLADIVYANSHSYQLGIFAKTILFPVNVLSWLVRSLTNGRGAEGVPQYDQVVIAVLLMVATWATIFGLPIGYLISRWREAKRDGNLFKPNQALERIDSAASRRTNSGNGRPSD